MRIHKSLNATSERLSKAREELRIVEEQIFFQMDVTEEAKGRMLVAETPLAERDYQQARADYERMLKERDRVAGEIAQLEREQDRLLDQMLGA